MESLFEKINEMLKTLSENELNEVFNLVVCINDRKPKKNKKKQMHNNRIQAKNFSLVYEKKILDTAEVIGFYKKNHSNVNIELTETRDNIIVGVSGEKQRFSKTTTKFNINDSKPVITTESVKSLSIKAIDNLNSDSSDIVKIDRFVMGNFSIEQFIKSDDPKSYIKTFELYVSSLLKSLKVIIPSEYMLSAILFCCIAQFSIKDKDLHIIGIDSKIEENYKGNKFHFRCDTSFIYKKRLFIMEYKRVLLALLIIDIIRRDY